MQTIQRFQFFQTALMVTIGCCHRPKIDPCRGYADSILTQVFYLPCLIFRQEIKGDHHGQDSTDVSAYRNFKRLFSGILNVCDDRQAVKRPRNL